MFLNQLLSDFPSKYKIEKNRKRNLIALNKLKIYNPYISVT